MKVKKPIFIIKYENEDITADIADHIVSIIYTDRQHGNSDDIEITLIDEENLWRSDLFPKQGDVIHLELGFEDEELLDCGGFEVDAPSFNLFDPLVTLKAVSTSIKKSLKENNVTAYTNKTLKQIIDEIAGKHDLNVIGNIENLKFKRKTQNSTDLEYLRKLAEEYGYIFKVIEDTIIFTPYSEIEAEEPALEIDVKQVLEGSTIEANINDIYSACEVSYFRKGKLYTTKAEDSKIKSKNVLKVKERCENKEQAGAMAKANLWLKNKKYMTGTINIEGSPFLLFQFHLFALRFQSHPDLSHL